MYMFLLFCNFMLHHHFHKQHSTKLYVLTILLYRTQYILNRITQLNYIKWSHVLILFKDW